MDVCMCGSGGHCLGWVRLQQAGSGGDGSGGSDGCSHCL